MDRNWRFGLTIVLLFLLISLIVEWANPYFGSGYAPLERAPGFISRTSTEDLTAYFPALPGSRYLFAGQGQEFASFIREITHVSEDLMQVEDLSGTNLVQIVEFDSQAIKVVWSQEEFYEKRSILDMVKNQEPNLILLKAPLLVGTTWTDQRFKRKIVQVHAAVKIPLGLFSDVLVVQSEALEANNAVHYEYYAKNIGLIKRKSIFPGNGEEYIITSNLESLSFGS